MNYLPFAIVWERENRTENGKLVVPVTIDAATGFSDTYYLAELKSKEVSKVKHPVSVKVKYYLDGKPMEASKLDR